MKKAESEPPLSVQVKVRNPEAQGRTGEHFFHLRLVIHWSRAPEQQRNLHPWIFRVHLDKVLSNPTALSKGLDKEPPEVTSHLNYYSVLQF